MHIKLWKLLENLLKKCQARPASIIPYLNVDKLSFDRLLIRPSVLDFFSQPSKLLLQGVDPLVDGLDFGGIG